MIVDRYTGNIVIPKIVKLRLHCSKHILLPRIGRKHVLITSNRDIIKNRVEKKEF